MPVCTCNQSKWRYDTWPWKVKVVTLICLVLRGTCHVISRMRNDDLALCLWAYDAWGTISRKPLEIETWVQRTINRKWPIPSPIVTWLMTSHDPERTRSWPQYIWGLLSRQWLEIRTWWNGKPIGNDYLGIKWSRDRWRHVTQKGQGRDLNILRAKYLENGWK